ncbi:MAG: VOC family protein [Blastomonas sp.]
MTKGVLEHVNLTSRDPDRLAQLFIDLFGWHVRWQGPSLMGGRTVHVGDDDRYLAIYTRHGTDHDDEDFKKGRPLNHVGFVVDDLDAVEAKVRAAGLEPWGHDDYDPGRRFYFYDFDGTEFEMVSYA